MLLAVVEHHNAQAELNRDNELYFSDPHCIVLALNCHSCSTVLARKFHMLGSWSKRSAVSFVKSKTVTD